MDLLECRFNGAERRGHYVFQTYRGGVYCYCYRDARLPLPQCLHLMSVPYSGRSSYIYDRRHGIAGFRLGWGLRGISPNWFAGCPIWFAAIAALCLPLLRLRGWHRRRCATRRRLCRGCGYDLRATPGRCPECGTIAGPSRAA